MAEREQPDRSEAAPAEVAQVQEFVPPYAKPTLTPLGRWALLTRAPSSEDEDDGFFQFGL